VSVSGYFENFLVEGMSIESWSKEVQLADEAIYIFEELSAFFWHAIKGGTAEGTKRDGLRNLRRHRTANAPGEFRKNVCEHHPVKFFRDPQTESRCCRAVL